MFDLTGELNRFAVAKATERDTQGVKECLETILVVSELTVDTSAGVERRYMSFWPRRLPFQFFA